MQAAGAALVAQLRTGGVELVTGNYLTELLYRALSDNPLLLLAFRTMLQRALLPPNVALLARRL